MESKIRALGDRIKSMKDKILTEEATKHSFVMPFLSALGYDVFDPTIVVPEFTADIGTKKGEKVDYAILRDGVPVMIIEVKNHTEKLDNHNNQLVRYFNVTDCKFGILTNGIEYRFFSDLEEKNKMDKAPFLSINLESARDRDIKELAKFAKDVLDTDAILQMASTKKYHREIQSIFKSEIENPSDDFVTFFAKKITEKRMTSQIIEEFRAYIKKSFSDVLNDIANDKIQAIQSTLSVPTTEAIQEEAIVEEKRVITTDEELNGFYIVRSIVGENVGVQNVSFKDTMSYFTILYQGKVTKWICRFYFNGKQRMISFPDDKGAEIKIPIDNIDELYSHKQELILSAEKRKSGKE
ncbi:MAG: hypothetical protein KU29_12245 [Sulfurovum sp. FS06-10]|nr:MAG: hypothetical protein KU29_12245 [Sulfurovum sp. FS06-10]